MASDEPFFLDDWKESTFTVDESSFDFAYRPTSKGDVGVIKDVFTRNAYDIKKWSIGRRLFDYYSRLTSPPLIIDAGANIGCASRVLLNAFPNSHIFAIEPEKNNFDLLRYNMRKNINVTCYQGAVASSKGQVNLIDPGASDWGFRTFSPKVGGEKISTVSCISPGDIVEEHFDKVPLVLKIDIEGAEVELFSNTDASWIDLFPLMMIELHDQMYPHKGSSGNFLRAIARLNVDFLHSGENIFVFNHRHLNSL
jgi:FkbM family methyltransferase